MIIFERLFISLLTIVVITVMIFLVDAFREHRRKHEDQELAILRDIRRGIGELVLITSDIRQALKRPILIQARITIMPKTIAVGEVATALVQGFDQFGQAMALDSSYTVAPQESNPAAATLGTPNPDGSFTATGASPDPADSISATITGGPNGVNVVANADVLTVTAPVSVLTSANVVLQ